MARRKTLPDLIRTKYLLAERLSKLRAELFGERGGPELARRLQIPVRTWYNYEAGVTVPAEVVLKIIELTSVEPMWLLHGKGPKFRSRGLDELDVVSGSKRSVGSLLRTALQILEQGESLGRPPHGRFGDLPCEHNGDASDEFVLMAAGTRPEGPEFLTTSSGPRYLAARAEWNDAERDCRCIRHTGDDMIPLIADGAYVAFSKDEEDPAGLDQKLVVAWVNDQPVVRWFQHCGRYGLIRAENVDSDAPQEVIDLDAPPEQRRLRRVLWINTPH
jgi:hypothetical protein